VAAPTSPTAAIAIVPSGRHSTSRVSILCASWASSPDEASTVRWPRVSEYPARKRATLATSRYLRGSALQPMRPPRAGPVGPVAVPARQRLVSTDRDVHVTPGLSELVGDLLARRASAHDEHTAGSELRGVAIDAGVQLRDGRREVAGERGDGRAVQIAGGDHHMGGEVYAH